MTSLRRLTLALLTASALILPAAHAHAGQSADAPAAKTATVKGPQQGSDMWEWDPVGPGR